MKKSDIFVLVCPVFYFGSIRACCKKVVVLLILLQTFVLPAKARNIVRGRRDARYFYLTFDGHTDSRNATYILDTLKKHNVRATFFLTGVFITRYPALVRAISKAGHSVGNHTFNHKFRYSTKLLVSELKKTAGLYRRVAGKEMLPIWRAPYLQHLGRRYILRAAERIGYLHIDISLSTRDWITPRNPLYLSNRRFLSLFRGRLNFNRFRRMEVNGRSWRYLIRRSAAQYNGVIILYHFGDFRKGKKDFIFTLDGVVRYLKREGYHFRTCDDFIKK